MEWADHEQIQNERLLFMTNLAEVDLRENKIQSGLLWIEQANDLRGVDTPSQFLVKLHRVEGELLAAGGALDKALEKFDEAIALLGSFNRYDRAQLLIQKGVCYIKLANKRKAQPLLEEGIKLSDEIGRLGTLNQGKAVLETLIS